MAIGKNSKATIGGVTIENPVAMNSCRGSVITDESMWATVTAEDVNKDHLLCTFHKTKNTPKHNDVTGDQRDLFHVDVSDIIYCVTSLDNLEDKFSEMLRMYAPFSKACNFIESIRKKRHSLCKSFTTKILVLGLLHRPGERGQMVL